MAIMVEVEMVVVAGKSEARIIPFFDSEPFATNAATEPSPTC